MPIIKKYQVIVVDDPTSHTQREVWLKDIPLKENAITLGEYLMKLENRIIKLEEENKKLKKAVKETISVAALINSK